MCSNKRLLIRLGVAGLAVLVWRRDTFGAVGPVLPNGKSPQGEPEQPETAKASGEGGPSASAAQPAAEHHAQ